MNGGTGRRLLSGSRNRAEGPRRGPITVCIAARDRDVTNLTRSLFIREGGDDTALRGCANGRAGAPLSSWRRAGVRKGQADRTESYEPVHRASISPAVSLRSCYGVGEPSWVNRRVPRSDRNSRRNADICGCARALELKAEISPGITCLRSTRSTCTSMILPCRSNQVDTTCRLVKPCWLRFLTSPVMFQTLRSWFSKARDDTTANE